jgi:hypothetical protein
VSVAGRIAEFLAGAFLVVGTILSAVRSTVLPRASQSRISNLTTRGVRWVFRKRAGRRSTFEGRDQILAMMAPIALLVLLATWLVLILTGYALMYLAVTDRTVAGAIELSGSSVFTLGTTSDSHVGPLLLTYTEAGIGLLLLTLLITYLPSIYTAFSRRENGVALLQVRAGVPPRATAMLIRYQRIEEGRFRLTELWRQWEAWFADVEETHTTFPILAFFRSPSPDRSWITSAGALLDAASFWAGTVEHPKDPDAQLCIRAGYLALRHIADVYRVAYDPDPAPDDPISVDRSEWDAAIAEMEEAAVPILADRDKAWADWKGWRVNYDTLLLNLARLVDAPPAPWLSDRSPVGPDLRWSLRGRVSGASVGLRRRVQSVRSGGKPASQR